MTLNGVPHYPVSVPDALARGCFFPPDISNDPWLAYHGTSSTSEAAIESNGLSWQPGGYSRDEVASVCNVFRSMNWAGLCTGGFGVLHSFTSRDFRLGPRKPIYLAETSLRSAAFALSDFAGGETSRGLRMALHDLRKLLIDPAVYAAHMNDQRRSCLWHIERGVPPSPVIRVDRTWLAAQLESFAGLEQRALAPKVNHSHGVVYAIRFPRECPSNLYYTGSAGFEAYDLVPRDWLVAKVHITDAMHAAMPRGSNVDFTWASQEPGGLAHAVEGRKPPPGQGESRSSPGERLDPAAGLDEALDHIARYASSELKAMMATNPSLRNALM